MEILGYVGALLIGISLGLIGGGGSILTIPVLVYFFAVSPVLATAYSLFVVGVSSIFGAISYMRAGQVDYRTAVVFAVPSLLAVFLTRLYVITAIPEVIYASEGFTLTKDMAIMAFFAVIMLLASFSMVRSGKKNEDNEKAGERKSYNYPLIFLEGGIVGVVTGLVGAGGGFLIVPALVLLVGLPMKTAVGTSLVIIAVKSLLGFAGDLFTGQAIDWTFLTLFTLLAVAGIFMGAYLARFVSGARLKKAFGIFVLVMACFILAQQLFFEMG